MDLLGGTPCILGWVVAAGPCSSACSMLSMHMPVSAAGSHCELQYLLVLCSKLNPDVHVCAHSIPQHTPPSSPLLIYPSSLTLCTWLVLGLHCQGDIGTSIIYVFSQIFATVGDLSDEEPDALEDSVLGAESLIFWSLTLIALVKYVGVVLRANDTGEGGRGRRREGQWREGEECKGAGEVEGGAVEGVERKGECW